MIGNAVPVEFARQLATVIYKDISNYLLPADKLNIFYELHSKNNKKNRKIEVF